MKENGRQKKKLVKTQKSKIYIQTNHFLKLCFVFSRKRKATFANETNGKINKQLKPQEKGKKETFIMNQR